MAEYQVQSKQDQVNVRISSNINSFASERRYQKGITILELKAKLELITGTSVSTTKLELHNKDDKFICKMDNDQALLGSYPIENDMIIHAIDSDPSRKVGEFEDVSKVEKYEINEDAYDKLPDTVRAFKKRNKMGRFSEDYEKKVQEKEEFERKESERIQVGSRCEVTIDNTLKRRGVVKFVGKTHFKPGYWVGVHYDEPYGKNDGSIDGNRYFECPHKYGSFVKPNCVQTGDFPEEMDFSDDEI